MGCLKLYSFSSAAALEQAPIFHLPHIEKSAVPEKIGVNYCPFGMTMPNRNTNTADYRYAYNGMEVDNEVKGNGNSYTTEFRQYDPRLGRWLSLDPLMAKYPGMSPYVAFNNNPIYFTDPLGLEGGPAKDESYHRYAGLSQNFSLNEFEKKLPSDVEVGTSFELNFQSTKAGDRTRVGYTYQGGGVWNRVINGRGTKYISENIKGNSSVSGTDAAEKYLTDGGATKTSRVIGNGGVGGSSDNIVTQKGKPMPSGVSRGGGASTPTAENMGAKPTNNNPTKNTGSIVSDNVNFGATAISIGSAVVQASSEISGKELNAEIDKVKRLGGKGTALADDATKLTKVAKAAKVLGSIASVVTVVDNISKAVNTNDPYEKAKYSAKATLATVALVCNFVPGIGTAASLTIFAVATAIEWFW